MRAGYATLGELHTVLSLEDVADAHDFLVADQDAETELRKRHERR